ncbi:MAG: hypothetical protein AB7S78_08340 [Candidatus Omnitrophota bacterium]
MRSQFVVSGYLSVLKSVCLTVLFLFSSVSFSSARIVYQDFEPGNGTPPKYYSLNKDQPEYGWAFGGAVVQLSGTHDPVHGGQHSWALTIPAGKPLTLGTGVAAQSNTYDVNFAPVCHDRLTFWIWSDPSEQGDHTVMVKFFDRRHYNVKGFEIWTIVPASFQQWSELDIMFDQLPKDFDLQHVDKIEFFNYWDGTYYYDDITVRSSFSSEQDMLCMEKAQMVACNQADRQGQCVSVQSEKGAVVLDYLQAKRSRLIGP